MLVFIKHSNVCFHFLLYVYALIWLNYTRRNGSWCRPWLPIYTADIKHNITMYMYPEFTNSMVSHSPACNNKVSAAELTDRQKRDFIQFLTGSPYLSAVISRNLCLS